MGGWKTLLSRKLNLTVANPAEKSKTTPPPKKPRISWARRKCYIISNVHQVEALVRNQIPPRQQRLSISEGGMAVPQSHFQGTPAPPVRATPLLTDWMQFIFYCTFFSHFHCVLGLEDHKTLFLTILAGDKSQPSLAKASPLSSLSPLPAHNCLILNRTA